MRTRLSINRGGGRRDLHEVECEPHTTILDALELIRANRDPTLAFRHSCHHGSCGTCGVLANGERVLMCTARPQEIGSEISLDPLTPFPVIRDLAVDSSPLHSRFPREFDYLRASQTGTTSMPPAEIPRFSQFEKCIECGLCESACPVEGRFIGPAALASYSREIEKQPDRTEEILATVAGQEGTSRCDRALACSRACPLGIAPARHIAQLQRMIDARET